MDPSVLAEIQRLQAEMQQSLTQQAAVYEARLAQAQSDFQQTIQRMSGTAAAPSGLPTGCKPNQPASFYGGKDADTLDSWLFSVEQYFALVGMRSEEQKVQYAGTYLRGSALIWFRSATSTQVSEAMRVTTWERFAREIRLNFCPLNRSKLARDRLVSMRQHGGLRDYIRDFRTLILDIPGMNEEEKLDRFVRGLKPHIRREVEIREPQSLDRAIQLSERFDALSRSSNSSSSDHGKFNRGRSTERYYRSASSHRDSSGPEPMDLNHVSSKQRRSPSVNFVRAPPSGGKGGKTFKRLTPELRKKLLEEGKCLYCREPGHFLNECPKRPNGQRGRPSQGGRSPSPTRSRF